jgi:hypothetical protein
MYMYIYCTNKQLTFIFKSPPMSSSHDDDDDDDDDNDGLRAGCWTLFVAASTRGVCISLLSASCDMVLHLVLLPLLLILYIQINAIHDDVCRMQESIEVKRSVIEVCQYLYSLSSNNTLSSKWPAVNPYCRIQYGSTYAKHLLSFWW